MSNDNYNLDDVIEGIQNILQSYNENHDLPIQSIDVSKRSTMKHDERYSIIVKVSE